VTARTRCALALLVATQSACIAHTIAGIDKDAQGADTFEVAPQPADAQLSCDGAPCAAVPVVRPYRAGRSNAVFWSLTVAELGLGFGAFAIGVTQGQVAGQPPCANATPCLLALLAYIPFFCDIGTWFGATDYGRTYEPARLGKLVTVSWSGRSAPVRLADVVPPGAKEPGPTFSVTAVLQRPQEGAQIVAPKDAKLKHGRVAVLELKSDGEVKPDQLRYFGDAVRAATLKSAPWLEVMTRENILVLLQASGKDLANCEGECEVDTGRRIGADAVVTGELIKLGSRYKLSLRLFDTHSGKQLSESKGAGASIEELDGVSASATAALFGVKP